MFTLEEIKAAHSKVKSGSDFPAYILDIKKLGVTYYETYVSDGHTDYYGTEDYKTTSPVKYEPLKISGKCDKNRFKKDLSDHQQGKTDFPTFCKDCAACGIDKWTVSMKDMTCIYYDQAGNEILAEEVPL